MPNKPPVSASVPLKTAYIGQLEQEPSVPDRDDRFAYQRSIQLKRINESCMLVGMSLQLIIIDYHLLHMCGHEQMNYNNPHSMNT